MTIIQLRPEPDQLRGEDLLDDVRRHLKRFVVLTDAQADAVALWVAHTHAIDAAECTPYIRGQFG